MIGAVEAREGKASAKTGHQGGKPVKLLMVSDLAIHLTRLNGTYFKSNYGRWALFVI
jgi:hypothetical protein